MFTVNKRNIGKRVNQYYINRAMLVDVKAYVN